MMETTFSNLTSGMNQNKHKELNLGMSIGLVSLTEEASAIICSLCATQTEFSKLWNLISHIYQEHYCGNGSAADYKHKIKSEVIDADLLEDSYKHGSICEIACTNNIQRINDSMFTMETTHNPNYLKKSQQEFGNETNMIMVKSEEESFYINEISSNEFYCVDRNTNILSGKEETENHIYSTTSPIFTNEVGIKKEAILTGERNFKCEICNKTFSTLKGFRTHKTRVHPNTLEDAYQFYCGNCDTNFGSDIEQLKHICSFNESSSADLIDSEAGTSIIESNKYSCTICSAVLQTPEILKRHMMTHNADRPLKCSYCPLSFIYPSRLKRHLQTHEPSSAKIFSCPHCPANLKSRVTLRYHLLRHIGQKSFKCEYCNGSYYTLSKLREHIKISHSASFGKQFRCPICPAIFKSQQSLNPHILKHKGEKPFKCEHCSQTFYRSDSLRRHMILHTGEKPFKCELCSSAFNFKDKLKHHMIKHSGKKPYKCEQCTSEFYRKDRLKAHMLAHSRNKPYKCEICSRAFNRTDSLKRHILSHSGKKPYSCEHCLSTFKTIDSLTLHMKKHTKKESIKVEIV